MTLLIPVINEITKYGLEPNLNVPDRNSLLEKNLVQFYALYFEINYVFDNTDHPDFDKEKLPDIRKNIESNFKHFGFYKTIIDINAINDAGNNGLEDAIDDLLDIITDLLEIKWRIENNSLADGLWFFEFIFRAHTQQHILDLLKYMKQKSN